MSRGYGRTIAPKTPIKPCDGESVKCSGSSRLPLPSAFSICMLLFTTRSTFNAISSRGRRCGYSEPKRQRNGEPPSSPHEVLTDPTPLPPNARYRDNAGERYQERVAAAG